MGHDKSVHDRKYRLSVLSEVRLSLDLVHCSLTLMEEVCHDAGPVLATLFDSIKMELGEFDHMTMP